MTHLLIDQFICREDNFGVLIHDPRTGLTGAIDAPEEGPILSALQRTGWQPLTHILVTHGHPDHVCANRALKDRFGARIIGPGAEAGRIPGIDETVREGDRFRFGRLDVEAIETPGHTLGHICHYLPEAATLFAGDTLFALGCGRLFEGTPGQMHRSLQRLAALPDDTVVYCGHEYTAANARFAVAVDPDNARLRERAREIDARRAAGLSTLPTTVGLEKATNPFLRVGDRAIRAGLGMEDASDVEVFADLRRRKDGS